MTRLTTAAGADIKEIAALDTETVTQRRYLQDLCSGMRGVKKPLLAAVEGIAVSQIQVPGRQLSG